MRKQLVNTQIPFGLYKVVGDTIEPAEQVSLRDALQLAEEHGLDLVLVAPGVCKVMDYGKHLYDQQKKDKPAKQVTKNVQIKYRIGQHDLATKVKKVQSFLLKGYRVVLSMRFRGREIVYKQAGRQILEDVVTHFSDSAECVSRDMKGRDIQVVLRPITLKE